MAGLNKVFLIGNLTRDPELRYTPSGAAVSDLGIATNRVYNTKEGERREETLFVDVAVWNRDAENCCQYLRKGSLVHVEGALKLESWEDKNTGEKRSKLKVVAERVQFLDSRRDGSGGGSTGVQAGSDYGHDEAPAPAPARRPADPAGNGSGPPRNHGAPPVAAAPRRPPTPPPADEDSEDIPF